MAYDHNQKAGNQGDVVKHVALIAALDPLLANWDRSKEFQYADTFAGYAFSTLIHGNDWKDGVGKLLAKNDEERLALTLSQLEANPHTKIWYEWYLKGRPQLLGGVYPGSSLVAHDLCVQHRTSLHMSLWDIAPSAIAHLLTVYKGGEHEIYPRPVVFNEPAITNSDFVFIDPPYASMKRKLNTPLWSDLLRFPQPCHSNFMIWMPVGFHVADKQRVEHTAEQRKSALDSGLSATVVRWREGIHTVGCQLFYRLSGESKASLRAAVDQIVLAMNWAEGLSPEVKSIEHTK